jgi:hypothetical protein
MEMDEELEIEAEEEIDLSLSSLGLTDVFGARNVLWDIYYLGKSHGSQLEYSYPS